MIMLLEIFSFLVILLSSLPFFKNQRWIFRAPEFMKLQITVLQVIIIILSFIFWQNDDLIFQILTYIQIGLFLYHLYLLSRYTKFWRVHKSSSEPAKKSETVKLISCNIYQFNRNYDPFIQLVKKEKPDIVLSMESDAPWEKALRVLEEDYPNTLKITLDNTYGMHFYTKLKCIEKKVNYFVSDDLPSVEVHLETEDGYEFVFFGVHPPPPSPTEESNSKERDGDLLSVAKKIRNYKKPVVVAGDFNNVAWADSSILFKKTSRLIDARIGRGFISTFHAKYWFFRAPLDLLFHSPDVFIDKLFVYPSVDSDHFPVGCEFKIGEATAKQIEETKDLEAGKMEEVNELIEEGKQEVSDNR